MKLTGLHLLLTYKCTFECEHCFVWGSPWQEGAMTVDQIHKILLQARDLKTIDWIYFEGGEPFLYYPVLLRGVQMATAMGFHIGIVSNAYWATTEQDALVWLTPLSGLIEDLAISSDLYHYSEINSRQVQNAVAAGKQLGIPIGMISVAQPEETNSAHILGQLPAGESAVMYRGRAACDLVPRAAPQSWDQFKACPSEDLRNPGRVHLDPLGNFHICQGVSIGNVFEHPLKDIVNDYDPEAHPICGPLLAGGPVALIDEYHLPHADSYADACHLCYSARLALREQFPEILIPDQMYGDAK